MINIKKNQLLMFINEYSLVLLLAIIIDVFINKGFAFTWILLFYYFIILLLSIIKRKKIKISLIKFLIPLFLIMNITFLTDIWDEEMKKNIVKYYNNSTLIKGLEEKEITAYNMSRQVILYVENNKKVASVFLFNFKKFHYDDENKWKEVD